MGQLLPDRLKELWQLVARRELTVEACQAEQERLLDVSRRVWAKALRLDGETDLEESSLMELGRYVGCADRPELRSRCHRAVADMKREWEGGVDRNDRASIEQFYDASRTPIYELIWWHTLADDLSPLGYVMALDYAKGRGGQSYLDFGAGVGSGAILFARHGFDVTLGDISSPLLDFCRWRLAQRGLPATYLDLKSTSLPPERFDLITAMDVFEHLGDPVSTVDRLWQALTPGGVLFGRFGAEPDAERPMHIVEDFEPTFARLRALGCVEVWRDEWLWGHQAFQKTP